MSALFDTIEMLQACLMEEGEGLDMRVAKIFREAFERAFQEDKMEYLRKALDGNYLPWATVAKVLGYEVRSAINAVRKGSISHEKFELLVGVVGDAVKWPPARERKISALIATITYVRKEVLHQEVRKSLDREGVECLEQALCDNDHVLGELQQRKQEGMWIKALTALVSKTVPLKQPLEPERLLRLLAEWGAAYVRTKNALFGFVR